MLIWWKSAVNLSFFLSFATCRMRSSACDTLTRLCARRVLCWPAFPLASVLGSTGSAADRSALFASFAATMAESDFPRPPLPRFHHFGAQSHTPRTRCVRFVFGVAAASRNTRFQAARYGLTWVGLAPTDRASFAWRLPSLDHLVGAQQK